MILTFAVSGYRSLRKLILPLEQLNIITGPNGSGKSSFYKSLRLLADAAQGQIVRSLAVEGGLPSTLWAGPEKFSRGMKSGNAPSQGTVRRDRVGLKLGFASEDYGYAIDLGLAIPQKDSLFNRDPEIKAEAVWTGDVLRRNNMFASRNGPGVHILDETGARATVLTDLSSFDSMMTHAADPRAAPELLELRERMRGWRFYDHFRTDSRAPARRAQIGTRTAVLDSDGTDVAAALQTINEIGDPNALDEAIEDAFPGCTIEVSETDGLFEVTMHQDGLLRPLRVSELATVSPPGGGAADAEAAVADGNQRAGDEPAPRFTVPSGAPYRQRRGALTSHRRFPCRTTRRNAVAAKKQRCVCARKRTRRNDRTRDRAPTLGLAQPIEARFVLKTPTA